MSESGIRVAAEQGQGDMSQVDQRLMIDIVLRYSCYSMGDLAEYLGCDVGFLESVTCVRAKLGDGYLRKLKCLIELMLS